MIHAEAHYIKLGARIASAPTSETFERRLEALRHMLQKEEQRDLAESILRAVGVTVWVADEALMDVVTAVSGSGPAYFFLVMEALEAAAIREGLDPKTARLLTLETAFGAAKMALEDAGYGAGDAVVS